jgi:hypothetical protein
MRQLAGVMVKDLPRYLRLLARRDVPAYLGLCNRNERLEPAPDGSGFRCDWQWASDLHAPRHLPVLGKWLAAKALADHPIRLADRSGPVAGEAPQLSFIIGHRGRARIPHLLSTLASIAAQGGPRYECLVVEQDAESVLGPHLPPWVTCIRTPPPDAAMPYCRSWAFNVGARHARGRILVLHDNDMLVPSDYAQSLLSRVDAGFDVVNLKRFVFYLSEHHTAAVLERRAGLCDRAPQVITQNLEGGGTVAITRDAYASIGGMDESFLGWGGEDNEFWDRAQTLRAWSYGSLPFVHLWHPAQPGKQDPGNRTATHYAALSRISTRERIDRLTGTARGLMAGPAGYGDAA